MDESAVNRIKPHDSAAEKAVVGSMLMDRAAIGLASEILIKDDFYEKQYGIVFEAIVELDNEGKPIDIVSLKNRLREKNVPEEIISLEFLNEVMGLTITSAHVRQYAEYVKENSLLRKLIDTNDFISGECYAHNKPLNDIFEETEKRIFDIVAKRNTGDYVPINKIVENSLKKIQQVMMSGGGITGIATGFTDLDEMLSGLQPSDLVLIAARPSMGKTAFALNIALNVSLRNSLTTAIFSLEMPKESLVNRLIAMDATVDAQKLRKGNLDDNEVAYVMESAARIGSSKLIIDDVSSVTTSELRSKCRKYKIEHDLKLVIIDYLQLMSSGQSRGGDSRNQEISDISRALKSIARELDVPVIALSQLSRNAEKREGHKPQLSDLRDSGAIEQDADVVMFLYREDYYDKGTEKKNITEINVAKQRNGPIGTVELVWRPQYTKFANKEN
ncbi:MAG: replicative DNA helicase [Lachnospiraceae bacterium]|nr:replicative DNA helicase [Lachnospiraceae bacterium]